MRFQLFVIVELQIHQQAVKVIHVLFELLFHILWSSCEINQQIRSIFRLGELLYNKALSNPTRPFYHQSAFTLAHVLPVFKLLIDLSF